MTGGRLAARQRGSLPGGGARNGLERPGGYYRRFGDPDWNPAEGRHHNPEEVLPQVPAIAVALEGRARASAIRAAEYEQRLATVAHLDAEHVLPEVIEKLTGFNRNTQNVYRRVLKEREQQVCDYCEARSWPASPEDAALLAGVRGARAAACEKAWHDRVAAGGDGS